MVPVSVFDLSATVRKRGTAWGKPFVQFIKLVIGELGVNACAVVHRKD